MIQDVEIPWHNIKKKKENERSLSDFNKVDLVDTLLDVSRDTEQKWVCYKTKIILMINMHSNLWKTCIPGKPIKQHCCFHPNHHP